MENYRYAVATFQAEASSTLQRSVEELSSLLSVEVDKIRSEYLSHVQQYLRHLNALLESSLKTAVPQTMELLQIFRVVIQRPALEYSIEAISEGIRSQIVVAADLRRLLSTASTDFHLLLSLSRPTTASVSFDLDEVNAGRTKRQGNRRNMSLQNWLCRNCMILNMHYQRTCKTCGYQPKDTQAEH